MSELRELTTAEHLVAGLDQMRVDFFFGNGGTDFPSIVEAFANRAKRNRQLPRPMTIAHENLAMSMAHGCYLATGRMQAVMVHVGVGTANALCGVMNAARDQVPILLMAGRTPLTEEGSPASRNVYIHWAQDSFDQGGMLREYVKWDYELRAAEQIGKVLGPRPCHGDVQSSRARLRHAAARTLGRARGGADRDRRRADPEPRRRWAARRPDAAAAGEQATTAGDQRGRAHRGGLQCAVTLRQCGPPSGRAVPPAVDLFAGVLALPRRLRSA